MLGLNRWHLLKGLAAILSVASIVSLTLIYVFPAPPSAITIASGFQGGNYEIIAELYKRILARNHVNLEMHPGSGGWDNVKLLLDQNSGVQTAFVQGGMGGSEQAPGMLSLGRINYQIFFIFYRAAEMLEDLTDLRGKRIAAGTVGTGSRAVIERILGISGVASENSTLLPLSGQAAFNAVNDGRADAAIIGLESDSPLIHSLLRDSRLRLMSVTRAEALTRFFPFLTRLVLPQGAIDFEKKIPADDVVLFANTNSVLVRDDLHPAHVRLLAQALVETHNKPGLFQRAGEFPTQTNSEYPMAEGAVDFYRNGPPLLNRYLPFWIVPHVLRLFAVLLAGGAIIYPLFSFAPKLYQWFVQQFIAKLYRRLRIVEKEMLAQPSVLKVVALQTDLENIARMTGILPMRHSGLFFDLNQHIDSTRTRLASRLVEVRSEILKPV
jgi:TRAP-type uncharacterized transport system substrate-binding protein